VAGERLPLARGYEIALAVSRCVWHAHRHGVLHRDIKPANVLLPVSRQPPAKLGDFGVARLAELAGSTPSGAVTGTPTYASPEALAGEDVGPPHDVYALGATLYTLFAGGRPPYGVARGESIASLRRLRLVERVRPLRALNPGIDGRVEGVLSQMLAPDPVLRPAVEEVVLALESTQARCSPETAVGYGQWTGSTRRPWRLLAAGVGLMVLGFWRRYRAQRRNDGRPTDIPDSLKEEPCPRGESPR
jgi:serine/threonine protein kinase